MRSTILLMVLGICACDETTMMTQVDSSGACDCPLPQAAEISYDNAASGLAAEDLQQAVDEVSERTKVNDSFQRITRVENTGSTVDVDIFVFAVACPDGHIALGGSCAGRTTGGVVASSTLQDTGHQCIWTNPNLEQGVELTAIVTCLAPPE